MSPGHYRVQITYCEGGVLLWCLLHLYLPEPQFEVQAGKMSSTYQTLQCLLYSGAGDRSPFLCKCSGGKSQCRIIGHPPSSLPTQPHYTMHSGWAHRWFWTSSTNGRGICLNCSLKEVSFHYFYCVFHRVGTGQFHWIQQEHAMVFGQELVGGIHQLGGPRV